MRVRGWMLAGLAALGGCGGGGTVGTNYSEVPPMAEIVATPAPRESATPDAAPDTITNDDTASIDNAVE